MFVNASDDIVPESCKFKVTDLHVCLTLAKVDARKWGALEASQAKSKLYSLLYASVIQLKFK
jgi:hypothetical protein